MAEKWTYDKSNEHLRLLAVTFTRDLGYIIFLANGKAGKTPFCPKDEQKKHLNISGDKRYSEDTVVRIVIDIERMIMNKVTIPLWGHVVISSRPCFVPGSNLLPSIV